MLAKLLAVCGLAAFFLSVSTCDARELRVVRERRVLHCDADRPPECRREEVWTPVGRPYYLTIQQGRYTYYLGLYQDYDVRSRIICNTLR